MSTLKSIEFTNFKGQSAIQELTGLDLLIGNNGTGKTTRFQALGMAMLGYIPGNKKTPADTFKLATGNVMSAAFSTEKFQAVRTITKNEKRDATTGATISSLKENILVSPGQGERKDSDKELRIHSEVGNFPVMMDFAEFLSLSDAKRRDFIYSLGAIGSDSWNKEYILKHLEKKLLTTELRENNPDQYTIMQDMIHKAVNEYPDCFGVQEGLQAILDWIGTQKPFWDQRLKDAKGAVRQISEMKNDMEETDRNIVAMKEELSLMRQQLITAEKTISADCEKKKALDKRASRIIELQKLVMEMEGSPVVVDVSVLDKQIEEHQGQLMEVPNTDERMGSLSIQLNTIRGQIQLLNNTQQDLNIKKTSVQAEVSALENALKATGELAGRCVINAVIKCDKDFSGFGGFVDGKKEKAATAMGEILSEIDGLNVKIAEIKKEETRITEEQAVLMKEVQELNARNTSINQSITALTNKKNEIMVSASERDNKLKSYKEEKERLMNEPAETVIGNELLEAQIAGLRSRIDELSKTAEEKEKAKQALLILQQSMIENRKAEYHSVCLKIISEALGPKGVQGELVKEIIGPIQQDIQSNLVIMGFDQEVFFQTESDTGKEIFQFGWINSKGHYVNFDALSTGQQTIFLAAMMVTIIDRKQPRLRLLAMDNINHLDRINCQLMIDGIGKISHKLDNVILAGAIAFPVESEGWKVWNLSPENAVEDGVRMSA